MRGHYVFGKDMTYVVNVKPVWFSPHGMYGLSTCGKSHTCVENLTHVWKIQHVCGKSHTCAENFTFVWKNTHMK